jgi:type IV secretory pathway VirB4 component
MRLPHLPGRAGADQSGGVAFGPDGVEVTARWVGLGGGYATSFAVVGYPAEVGAGWLEPLLCHPGRVDVSVHIEPTPPMLAADRLRRQMARLESTRRTHAERGRLDDPQVDAAVDDARDMAAALARGETRLFRAGLYLTVHAPTVEELHAQASAVRALAASLLLDAQPATFRSLQGWVTTLPTGVDNLGIRRTMDTAALAAGFPFTSPDLPATDHETGVLYGVNAASSGLVVWDRWAQDNHNSVVLARSGAGKSYLTKLDVLRSLYQGVEVAVIDPEDEYRPLCEAVGGAYLGLGTPGTTLNPLDLPTEPGSAQDALTERALAVHTLLAVMLGEPLTPAGRAAVDRAAIAAYQAAGITADPQTWNRPAPLLADLTGQLRADDDPTGAQLADRLTPYVTGSWRSLFDGPTTTQPDAHLTVWSLRALPDELRPVGTLLAVDTIWRRIANPAGRRRRLVVVDEAWLLMQSDAGARFLYRLAKSARKHWAGLVVVTQDAADVLATPLGQAVVNNAATQILLRQAPQAIDQITDAFRLSDGERTWLLSAGRGDGLLIAGPAARVAFRAVASDREHALAVTGIPTQPEPDSEPG